MSKRSSMRSKENPPDATPIPEEKSASQKNPYVFTRAFARLLGLDQEQAVTGYLAATSPGEPNPALSKTAAPPKANAPSGSSRGPITQNAVESRKATEIPNPSVKHPPGRVTESAPARGVWDPPTSLPKVNAPSDSSTGRPIAPKRVKTRKATEIPNSLSVKLPLGDAPNQLRVAESAPAQGESGRTTSMPKANLRPITQDGIEAKIPKVAETPNSSNVKRPLGAAQNQARVAESAPAQGESGLATSLPKANLPPDSSTGRPITPDGVEVEIPKVAEIPSPADMKRPLGAAQNQARVAESAPVQGESGPTTGLPKATVASGSSTGRPVTQNRVEIRKVVEVPNPNIKLPAGGVTESEPAPAESSRGTGLPKANAPSDSSTGRPILQNRVEIRKVVEVPNPNIKFPAGPGTESGLPQGDKNLATSLPNASAPSDSSLGRPITQDGVEIRKLPGVPRPANMKLRPGSQIQERLAILLLVVALGVAVWGFFTRELDTRVLHPVPSDSNSSASFAPGDSVPSSDAHETGAVSAASRGTGSFVVDIKARKNVWVLIRADGKKLTEEKLTGGAEKSIRATNQVVVKTGNPGALDFEFNGRKLPVQGTSGEVLTLEFGPSGLEVIISQPPTRIKPGK